MITKTDMPFVVHVYTLTVGKSANMGCSECRWHSQTQAISYAQKQFEKDYVYKVKVWNTELGPIIPNRWDAPALILELV